MKTQLTRQEAIKHHVSEIWKTWTAEEVVAFQLYQDNLCMPYHLFHESMEKVFDRPIFTHEFADQKRLIKEYENLKSK